MARQGGMCYIFGERDVIEMFRTVSDIRGRIDPRKRMEVVDEMRLIEIAAIRRYRSPLHRPSRADPPQHSLESPHAAKQLGREPDFAAEHLYESLRAEADLTGNVRDGRGVRQAMKLAQCKGHGRVPFQPLRRLREQCLFQNEKPCLRRAGLQQPLAQLVRQSAPQILQRHQRVVQLAGGQAEKRESASRFEVYASY